MKKSILIILFCIIFISTGCEKNVNLDYSEYQFTGISWIRDVENDTETIRFNTDGSFSYSCACGNPLNNSDLCETYTYNNKTKEIKLECFEPEEDTITTIKVISLTDNTLELDFNGQIRTFEKNK